jgi:hypothetical protein
VVKYTTHWIQIVVDQNGQEWVAGCMPLMDSTWPHVIQHRVDLTQLVGQVTEVVVAIKPMDAYRLCQQELVDKALHHVISIETMLTKVAKDW